jgi:hypothetical protein
MSCAVPICYLLHRVRPDGTPGLLMAPDLRTAIADAAAGDGWIADRITFGRETVLEGEALRAAILQHCATAPE